MSFESEVLKEQRAEIARNAQPILNLEQGGNGPGMHGGRQHEFWLVNHGKSCTSVRIRVGSDIVAVKDVLAQGARMNFTRELSAGEIEPFSVIVDYIDERLMLGQKGFEVFGDKRFTITTTGHGV